MQFLKRIRLQYSTALSNSKAPSSATKNEAVLWAVKLAPRNLQSPSWLGALHLLMSSIPALSWISLLMRPINIEQAVVEISDTEGNVIHGSLSFWLEKLRLDWFISYHSALPLWLFLLGEYSRVWLKVGLFVQIVTVQMFQYKGCDICNTYKTKRTQSYHLLNLFISVILQISELFRHCFFVKNDGWIHQDIIKWPLPGPYINILLLPMGPMIFLTCTYRGHDHTPPRHAEKKKNTIQLQKMIRKIPTNFHVSYVCSLKYRTPPCFLYQQENKGELLQERLRLDSKEDFLCA